MNGLNFNIEKASIMKLLRWKTVSFHSYGGGQAFMTYFEKAQAYILAVNSNTKKLIATIQINFI
jgi:hypothetical protein